MQKVIECMLSYNFLGRVVCTEVDAAFEKVMAKGSRVVTIKRILWGVSEGIVQTR